jgi:hypothetical protein
VEENVGGQGWRIDDAGLEQIESLLLDHNAALSGTT